MEYFAVANKANKSAAFRTVILCCWTCCGRELRARYNLCL